MDRNNEFVMSDTSLSTADALKISIAMCSVYILVIQPSDTFGRRNFQKDSVESCTSKFTGVLEISLGE